MFLPRLLNWNLCGLLVSVEHQDSEPIFSMAVNHEKHSAEHTVESKAACTTNYLLGSRHEGRERQVRPSKRAHDDDARDLQRRSRSRPQSWWHASENIISSMCAVSTVREVNLELNGKLTGMVFRAQTPDASVGDLRCRLSKPKPAKMEDFHKTTRTAATGPMEGINLIRYQRRIHVHRVEHLFSRRSLGNPTVEVNLVADAHLSGDRLACPEFLMLLQGGREPIVCFLVPHVIVCL